MGRGQAVRLRVLVPSLGGSNPSVPDRLHQKRKILLFNNFLDIMWSNPLLWILGIILRIISFLSFGFSQTRSSARVEIKIFLLIPNSKKNWGSIPIQSMLVLLIFILKLVTYGSFVFHIREMGILTWCILNRNGKRPFFYLYTV